MADERKEIPQIGSLPSELLCMILLNNNCHAILNFASTCKYFHKFVSDNQYMWKEKFKQILPHMCHVIEKKGDRDWISELKRFFTVKHEVFTELRAMSSKHYWRTDEITMNDVENFFKLALSHNMNHYYVVRILQAILRRADSNLSKNYCKQPYTLTEMYYAKIALFYLSHTYLVMNWFQKQIRSKLRATFVLNFFMRWTDPMNVHTDDAVESAIMVLVKEVGGLFPNDEGQPNYTVHEKILKGLINEKDVLHAISKVIFRRHRLVLMPSADLDTLDIVRVLKTKCGHVITIGVIYQAVAHRCGVLCNLTVFPNHFFLEWRDQDRPHISTIIDLETGALQPKGRCPYLRNPDRRELRYCPNSFLQYVLVTFLKSMGTLKNWNSRNALLLQDFLNTSPSDENPFKEYKAYLIDLDRLPAMTNLLDKFYIDDSHLKILEHLVSITYNPLPMTRPMTVTRRDSRVLLAVGMICYHQRYNYLGVIRGWHPTASDENRFSEDFTTLTNHEQPFYNVVALDGSERLVAQENLTAVTSPIRLYHFEDVMAKDFTHFDGFCYVPNTEKEQEYPDDGPIRALYKDRFKVRTRQLFQME